MPKSNPTIKEEIKEKKVTETKQESKEGSGAASTESKVEALTAAPSLDNELQVVVEEQSE